MPSAVALAEQGANSSAIDDVARNCGLVAVGCSDAAGHIAGVSERIGAHLEMLAALEQVTATLEADQRRVADSTDEARVLSEQARAKLDRGRKIRFTNFDPLSTGSGPAHAGSVQQVPSQWEDSFIMSESEQDQVAGKKEG